jgi:hypothetical protein
MRYFDNGSMGDAILKKLINEIAATEPGADQPFGGTASQTRPSLRGDSGRSAVFGSVIFTLGLSKQSA